MSEKTHTRTVIISSLVSALVSAVISAGVTVGMQRYLEITFPTPQIIQQMKSTGLMMPDLSFSIANSYEVSPGGSALWGLYKESSIYYYKLSIGNQLNHSTGSITASLECNQPDITVYVLKPASTEESSGNNSFVFQIPALSQKSGRTSYLAIRSSKVPDITKIKLKLTSDQGDFIQVPQAQYDSNFTPIK